jgi:hypothetical protein
MHYHFTLHLSKNQPDDGPTNWAETCSWKVQLIMHYQFTLQLSKYRPEDGPTNWAETCSWNVQFIMHYQFTLRLKFSLKMVLQMGPKHVTGIIIEFNKIQSCI